MNLVVIRRVNKVRMLVAHYSLPKSGCEISFDNVEGDIHSTRISPNNCANFIGAVTFNRHRRFKRRWFRGKVVDFNPLAETKFPRISLVFIRLCSDHEDWDFWDEQQGRVRVQYFENRVTNARVELKCSQPLSEAYETCREKFIDGLAIQLVWDSYKVTRM